MSSKDLKPQLYYYIRRGWYGQLKQLCEDMMGKKGKDPVTLFWHAFALGLLGKIPDSLRELESFQSRRDLQLPMTVAMIYFHQKASPIDREAVSALKQELLAAETVTKEAGLILTARFYLFVGNYSEARQITRRLLSDVQRATSGYTTTVFEMEAYLIDYWCTVEELAGKRQTSSDGKKALCSIESNFTNNTRQVDMQDLDSVMCWARIHFVKGSVGEALNTLNQGIAMNVSFLPALADKALLLASNGEWEQALDTAQRLLDVDPEHLDALQVNMYNSFPYD
jgi:tetratricopeptide (TPR) repeat protein